MIPTGYRLATADDLREGVEVLIPADVVFDGDAKVTCTDYSVRIWSKSLPGLALVRDDAPDEPTLGEHEASVIRLRASIADLTAERDALRTRAEKAEAECDRLRAARVMEECNKWRTTADRTINDLGADLLAARRDLATATDAALTAGAECGAVYGLLAAAAGVCGLDDDAEPRVIITALVERARGGR